MRRLLDRLEGHWLNELAAVDARGAAGAEEGQPAGSTAGWLRNRLRLGSSAASSAVRTARALFRGPLTATAHALTGGELSVAHAHVIAHGTQNLPDHVTLEAEAGQTVLAALEPLARPADAQDTRSGVQRRADALTELARRHLEGGRLPQTGGIRPQLLVSVDLDSLLGHPSAIGGAAGWAGPLEPEACRRLACDAALTRVLVSRRHHHPLSGDEHHPNADVEPVAHDPSGEHQPAAHHHSGLVGLAGRLRAALTVLPPALGGAPTQPLEVGRTSRVVQPAQRTALAIRDGGCVFPDCTRPLAWCEAHHLRHWLHGGPTDLANLALLCRAHHRAVHEGGVAADTAA